MLEPLVHFVVDVLVVAIFYWPGWIVLRIVTLGRYPNPGSRGNAEFVAACGLVSTLIALVVIFS